MNDRPLHDDTHQDEGVYPIPEWMNDLPKSEPLPPVWRRWAKEKEDNPEWFKPKDEPDEPTGHTETILELIKRVSALEARVMLLESLNKQPYFDSLLSKTDVSDPIYASPTIEG